MAKHPTEQSNVSSELWAEAMGQFTMDTSLIDRASKIVKRARDRRKKNQARYAEAGVPAAMIAKLYGEDRMTESARISLYAIEQVGRRALDLWNAETPEDFNRIMERAAATEAAIGLGAEAREHARVYVYGFNAAMHGHQSKDDNPHAAGTRNHVTWLEGYGDASKEMAEMEEFLSPPSLTEAVEREAGAMAAATDTVAKTDAPAKRPSRKKAAAAPPAEEPAAGIFEMPEMPGLPN